MADSDSNIIKPVGSLQNIPPAGRRENRKRRQQPHKPDKEYSEQEQYNSADEQDLQSELDEPSPSLSREKGGRGESENDRNTIDYCA